MSKQFDPAAFLAFCRTQPRDKHYSPYVATACALAQFGIKGVQIENLDRFGIPDTVFDAALGCGASFGDPDDDPFTFGALADRLSALKETQG